MLNLKFECSLVCEFEKSINILKKMIDLVCKIVIQEKKTYFKWNLMVKIMKMPMSLI